MSEFVPVSRPTTSRRHFLRVSGAAAAAIVAGGITDWKGVRPAYAASSPAEVHVLNRITWGVRPADLDKIRQMGIEKYIDWQLQPADIGDPLADFFLGSFAPKLTMSLEELTRLPIQTLNSEVQFSLVAGRIIRAILSERQLYERMVEFWTDHFNVPLGDHIAEKVVDDREVIRKNALGKFGDLLLTSAQSPAMLLYLDNASSDKANPNENYARELMELHTLGVNGGYTEHDVKAVARALTGWTLRKGLGGQFGYNDAMHDKGEKVILGSTFPAGRSIEDGLQLLDMLASHPSTAKFISTKLCRSFVSDTPSQNLIDSTAQVFLRTDGNIRDVMRHILTSPEFMQSQGAKFRRPLEFMVAMLRLTRADVQNSDWLGQALIAMGHLPFFWQPPNGYPDGAGAWLNTNGLLNRWKAAFALMTKSTGGTVKLPFNELIPPVQTAAELVDKATLLLLGGTIHPEDRDQLIAFVASGAKPSDKLDQQTRDAKLPLLMGLLLASPYFQWH